MRIRDMFKALGQWPTLYPSDATPTRGQISLDEYLSYFAYDGSTYPLGLTTMTTEGEEHPSASFDQWARNTIKRNGVVFGCMLIRMSIFAEATFAWRQRNNGKPGPVFGTDALRLLERPWPRGTTDQLLRRAIQDADLAGNAYLVKRRTPQGERLRRWNPSNTVLLLGAEAELVDGDNPAEFDLDVLGYQYRPHGIHTDEDAVTVPAEDVAHWSPIPDPDAMWRGMSWLTPIVREVASDNAATIHKDKFFRNAATPNLMIKLDIADVTKFKEWVELFNENHQGSVNAYKTLFLGAGADPTIIGRDFQQLDFKNVQGAGENRIAMAAGVPPTILGTSEGMQGSTLNAGNYNSSRRRFADGTMRPLWRSACAAFETVVDVPNDGAELWYHDSDISFLQEDKKDQAEIQGLQARAIRQLLDAGYTADSAVDAITSDDMSLLEHSGLFSVQLQPPGNNDPSSNVTASQE